MAEKILSLVTARGDGCFAELNREISKLKCAGLLMRGRGRIRYRLIKCAGQGLRKQNKLRHGHRPWANNDRYSADFVFNSLDSRAKYREETQKWVKNNFKIIKNVDSIRVSSEIPRKK